MFLAALALFTPAVRAADQAAIRQEAQAKEASLIKLLESDAPGADKAMACKQLTIVGSKACVPALAPLLKDEHLCSWARIPLEAIPGDDASAALREASKSLDGRLLVGVLNSIGVRRDAQAVELLAGQLNNKQPAAGAAAAVALGRIGGAEATKTLRGALAIDPMEVRSAVAEGCILCAEHLIAAGQNDEAAKIYDEVRAAKLPKPRRLEATRGAILVRGSGGVPLLLELLKSDDKSLVQIALGTARDLTGAEVADALAAEAARSSAERGALILQALGDRKDAKISPAVLAAAKTGPKQVRIAAIGLIQRLGDASSLPTLLDIAIEPDADIVKTAKAALAGLSGAKVDAEIAARLPKAEGKVLGLLIELVGQRRIAASTALLGALEHREAEIRSAALTALGETIDREGLPLLIAQALDPKHPEDAEPAQRALRAACVRMPDREACAAELAGVLPKASATNKTLLLEVLGSVGGKKAMNTIGDVVRSGDDKLQDTGTRVLGEWMTVDVAPVLLDLSKTAPDAKYQQRALRGYLRLARQFRMTDAERAEMCTTALAAAKRPAEQKLVLEVIERHPSLDGLKIAIKAGEIAAIKDDASRTMLAVASKLAGKGVDVREVLAQAKHAPVKIEIIKAEYGAGSKQHDVTDVLKKQVRDLPLIALPSANYNTSFGGDPAPNTVKKLTIKYRINDKEGEATFGENALIVLPVPK
jgi:HEAT repeat protein